MSCSVKEADMEFELHLERFDGKRIWTRFQAESVDKAWANAASFYGKYKAVLVMFNLTEIQNQGGDLQAEREKFLTPVGKS